MVEMDVTETSGVDWPAHLAPGWVVCKSATTQEVNALFGTTEGTAAMANEPQAPTIEDLQKQLAEKDEALTKAVAAQEAAEAKAAELEKAAAADADADDITKGMPAEVKARFEKMEADTAAAREELAKERDARLDDIARAEYGKMFKSLSIDADTAGPQFRQLEIISPELHKAVITTLKAADAQAVAAGLFKSYGQDGGEGQPTTALEKMQAKADEIAKADTTLTKEQAFAKAMAENGDLYKEYLKEKGH
jgi:hypothetical protein